VDSKVIKAQIWDTAGQERYRCCHISHLQTAWFSPINRRVIYALASLFLISSCCFHFAFLKLEIFCVVSALMCPIVLFGGSYSAAGQLLQRTTAAQVTCDP
jgi:GTPase SAR1 family protein